MKERGDHGFTDEPTRLFFFDIDGVETKWRADPEGAVRRIVDRLGEPFASASFVWFFSASTGWSVDEKTSAGPARSATARCACGWHSSPTGR